MPSTNESTAPEPVPPAEGAPDAAALDLGSTSAVIEAGLLMVFGPEGDPLPPAAFCAAASEHPDAAVPFGPGAGVSAHRIAAVLEAQRTGRLATDRDEAAAWIEAMLHPAGQPAVVAPAELEAEGGACEVGDEAEAAQPSPTLPASLTLGSNGVLDLGCLAQAADGLGARVEGVALAGLPAAAMLSAGTDKGGGAWRLAPEELSGLALFAEAERLSDFTLSLTFVTAEGSASGHLAIEVERAARSDSRAGSGPAAGSRPRPDEQAVLEAEGTADGEGVDRATRAMTIVAGLPPGAVLSAGVDNGDGSWNVPVVEAGHDIGVALPPGSAQELRLVLTAVSIGDRDGQMVTVSRKVTLSPGERIPLEVLDQPRCAESGGALPLDLQEVVAELGADGRIDAIVIGGLPDGTSLSRGTYDGSIGSWVVRPDQLEKLAVEGSDGRRLSLKVTAVCTDQTSGRPRACSRRLAFELDPAAAAAAAGPCYRAAGAVASSPR